MNDVLFKILGHRLPATELMFLRFSFAALSLLVVIRYYKLSLATKHLTIHFCRGLILFVGMALYGIGLNLVPLTDVIVINFTIPFFTLILARLFLKEYFDTKRWILTLLGFIGVLLVAQPHGSDFNPECLLLVGSAALFAASDILNKMYVTKESTIALLFYTAFFTALIGTIPSLMIWVHPTLAEFFLTFLLGIGANMMLFFLLKAFSYLEASATAPFRYIELLLSAASGYLFFGEIPKVSTALGAFLIIPATIILVIHEARKETILPN